MVATLFVVIPWLMYAYEASTGLTVAPKYRIGEMSNPQHLASTRRTAIGATIFAGPIAIWAFLATRERK
jgi:hypothetical protein